MENTIIQSPTSKNEDEYPNLNSDAAIVSSVKNEAFNLNNEDKPKENLILENTKVLENYESPAFSKESIEKVSCTLFESALNVMKTFFSPEKARSKISNPVNQQNNISELQSVHLPNKLEPVSSEAEIEVPVMKSPFPEENDLKDKKPLTTPMLSPLRFDLQNNDDESFLTTLSYDESFQSAVTHIDENGEVAKMCDNLSNSIFNNSQDFDLAESCSSFLENSECCLENTMLKNDSFSSKEISHNGYSSKILNENNEALSDVKNFERNDVEVPNTDSSYQGSEIFKGNHLDSVIQTDSELQTTLSSGFSDLNGISNELDFHESEVSTVGMVSNRESQIPDQITGSEIQKDVAFLLSTQSSSVKSKSEDFEKIEAQLPVLSERPTLENSPVSSTFSSFPFSPLSKSDLSEVDEMLLALKKDSGNLKSLYLDKSDATLTNAKNAHFVEGSNTIDVNQKFLKIEENFKHEIEDSSSNNQSDKSEEFMDHTIYHPVLPATIVSETTKSFGSQKEDQNDPRNSHTFTLSSNHEGVDFNSDKKFDKSSSNCFASTQQNNHTILHTNNKVNQIPTDLSPNVSEYISLSLTPSNSKCSEALENDITSENTKLFPGETVSRPSLKHSTPVSAPQNSNSLCSSMQKEAMNSLEFNEDGDAKIIYENHSEKSDFSEKSAEIFLNEDHLKLSNKNLNEKESDAGTVNLGSWVLPLKSNVCPKESSPKYDWNKPGAQAQISTENAGPPPTGGLNKSKNNSFDLREVSEENSESSGLEEIFCNKSASFDSQKSLLSKTAEGLQSGIVNQSKSLEVFAVINKTYDKIPIGGEPSNLNLTFDKKTDPIIFENGKPPTLNEVNDSCFKDSNGGKELACEVNSVNNVSEYCLSLEFMSDKQRSEPSESTEAGNFLSPIKEHTEPINQTSYIIANGSLTKNIDEINIDGIYFKDNHCFNPSPPSEKSAVENQISTLHNGVHGKMKEANEISNKCFSQSPNERITLSESGEAIVNYETLSNLSKNIEPDVAQLIEQQFTPSDIAKICDIANLQENMNSLSLKGKEDEAEGKVRNVLSPKSFDFLSSIQGKPTGRDLSRESLYVKFDPLVQPPTANSLIDFTKEVYALAASETSQADHSSSICEELLSISPEKKSDAIVPPLTPLSDRNKRDKVERQKELENEIYFLKNLYSERERVNKTKMEEYESRIAKLTGDKCVLEDKLKEYGERERSLVKKMTAQTHDIEQLKIVMKEYMKVITMLTTELETMRRESAKQIETLTAEKESYMDHLQNTEAAFSDVHAKYEKSKKTIENLKKNEIMYKTTISDHAQKMEEYKKKAKEAQEKAVSEFQNIMLELDELKSSHSQEVSRLRALLKKTELKLEAVQESLDQKLKENQQLTAICDELIEGKK